MQSSEPQNGGVADAQRGNWVDRYFPELAKPFARLARWDRPIGFWLLFWPCAFSLAMAAMVEPARGFNMWTLILMFIGAVAMRGAGCTLNDIVDAELDAQVERTRSRPIPSGDVSKQQAALFLSAQLLVGFMIICQFNWLTIGLGVLSLGLVAIYPFMKRVTWWPQLFLGLAFSWGALLGWTSETDSLSMAPLLLYVGSVLWVIGYDTIYALQDVEDDVMVGIKSTARLFGERAKLWVGLFYAGALACWLIAGVMAGGGTLFVPLLLIPGLMLAWQVATLDLKSPQNALVRFKANHWVGLALMLAFLVEHLF
ncbi:MAG: 4-hydroxybenzoate octaprenyltransferase [Hyphomicrobiales bacterium]|nr:MAG: 4-hydroxybenzoate octaprenyltransferase [Hyphomicrobiales bacterium]